MTETRALTAALSGPVFDGAASRSALHASDRHAERWAPEGEGARRASGVRSLAFADRVASPWMSATSQSRMSQMFASYAGGSQGDRAVPQVSWLFPRPWFQDELDWMAAARQGLESTPRRGAMTTRGTFVSPAGESGWAGVAMPVLSPDVMAAVAPSMSGGDMASGLRAWSPSVDFAAASAAEVMAGAMQSVTSAGLPAIAERSPIWSGLSMVTPRGLAIGEPSSYATTSTAATMPRSTSMPVAMGVAPSNQDSLVQAARQSIARIESRVEDLRAPAAVPTPSADASVASTADATAAMSPSSSAPAGEPFAALSLSEERLAGAANASPAASSALRTVELLLGALASRNERRDEAPRAAGGEASTAPGQAAASHFAPIAGPRVAMPAGLGGLVQSLAAAQSVARPMAQVRDGGPDPMFTSASASGPLPSGLGGALAAGAAGGAAPYAVPSFSPVWAAPTSGALASVASSPARAIDHLSWSDRWLARFSGASPLAMSAFDSASELGAPTLRQLAVGSPEVVYVHPQLATSTIAAMVQRSQSAQIGPLAERAPRMAPVAAPRADGRPAPLRIDDSEAVPDSVFAAIAAAPATTRRDAVAADVARTTASVDAATASAAVTAPPTASPSVSAAVDMLLASGRRASVADLLAVSAPTAPDAGLAPGLASSPMAPALSAVLPMAAAPVFDPRALHGSALAGSYLGGMVARAAAPVGVLATAPSLAALSRAGAEAPTSPMSSAWTLRDLALAPQALRLAATAPNATYVNSPDFARGRSRDEVAVARAAASFAADAAMTGAMTTGAMTTGAVSTGAVSTGAVSTGAVSTGAVSTDVFAPPAGVDAVDAERGSAFAPGPAGLPSHRVLEAELVALRSAMLASPSASSVPLAHAAHAPLISGSVAVPAHGASQLAPIGGMVSGVAAPLAAAQARGSAAAFADGISLAYAGAPGSAAYAPSIAAAGGRPGSLAEAALAWSVGEERSAANLAFDFVTPELILAAKVYGLSAGAAAQAVRLAAAGPASMASMATQLDLTLLRAFQAAPTAERAFAAERGAATTAGAPARPASSVEPGASPVELGAFPSAFGPAEMPVVGTSPAGAPDLAASAPSATAWPSAGAAGLDPWTAAMAPFGGAMPAGPARLPRGAFLWPPGAVAALGLRALSPDGAAGLPVVALELLAAQAVAQLGTWVTAFPGAGIPGAGIPGAGIPGAGIPGAGIPGAGIAGAGVPGARGIGPAALPGVAPGLVAGSPTGIPGRDFDPSMPMVAGGPAAAITSVLQGPLGTAAFVTETGAPVGTAAGDSWRGASSSPAVESAAQIGDDAVEASAVLAVPPSARQRFESVYVALARSAEGQSLSPAARAARAMSLFAGSTTGTGAGMTAREAAAATWSMLPDVYRGGLDLVAPQAAREGATLAPDARPGLAGLAARAGEALGSFVSPSLAEVQAVGRDGDAPPSHAAAARAAAAPIYVDTAAPVRAEPQSGFARPRPGRAFTQHGGGEPEIPSWFESAAQKLFSGGGGDDRAGMSLAQMVLVTAMPSQQVAAATRGASSSGGAAAPGAGGGKQGPVDKPDVDKLALEVFHEVMHLLDIARQRSGDSQ